jgi:hypothetical protein
LPVFGEHWHKVQNIEKVAESLKKTQEELMKDIKRRTKSQGVRITFQSLPWSSVPLG